MDQNRSSDIVLERLTKLHPKLIDLELDRTQRLLAAVGHPERQLPPVIHVAGTNGKGSVIAYLRSILEAAGYQVHVYISPHLVKFHERIRLNGKLIDENLLISLLEECEHANGGVPITFFEITTVAAFLAFTREPADIVLLETGVGGEFDATNVIDQPIATVLMPISFDHMQFFGNTLTLIAKAKAGIMKHGRPAIVSPQPDEAMAVFEAKAAELKVPMHRFGREWTCDGDLKNALRFTPTAGVPASIRRRALPAATSSAMPAAPSPPRRCWTASRSPTPISPPACATSPGLRACSVWRAVP